MLRTRDGSLRVALSSGYCSGWPHRLQTHVAEPMPSLHPCHHGHFIQELLMMTGVAGERGWLVSNMCHLMHLIFKIILGQGHLLVSIYMGHKYLHCFCSFREVNLLLFFPNFLVTNHVPYMFLTIQPNHWPQPMHWYKISCLATPPSKQSQQLSSAY